jgi:ferrous iron transport protein A
LLKPLNQLGKNGTGLVKENHTSGELKRRLLDMGMVLNAPIKVLKIAPLGSPIDILVKGYQLSLRKDEAEKIMIEVE